MTPTARARELPAPVTRALQAEQLKMGRPIELYDYSAIAEGLHIVYDTSPSMPTADGGRRQVQRRWAIYLDDKQKSSGVISTSWVPA